MKVQALISHRINGIPLDYKVDSSRKEEMFLSNKKGIAEIKARDPGEFDNPDSEVLAEKFSYEPIICNVNEKIEKINSKKKTVAKKGTLEFYEQEAIQQQPATEKINYTKMGVYKEKRVSLSHDQLISNLLELFRKTSEYKLNDLVEILNHPI